MRERYIQIRKSNNLEVDFFYDYYLTECKQNILSKKDFIKLFSLYLPISLNNVLEYLDNVFKLTIITYNNKIIDVY